jgi:hypothetical protein
MPRGTRTAVNYIINSEYFRFACLCLSPRRSRFPHLLLLPSGLRFDSQLLSSLSSRDATLFATLFEPVLQNLVVVEDGSRPTSSPIAMPSTMDLGSEHDTSAH